MITKSKWQEAVRLASRELERLNNHKADAEALEAAAAAAKDMPGVRDVKVLVWGWMGLLEVSVVKMPDIAPVLRVLAAEGYRQRREPEVRKNDGEIDYLLGESPWMTVRARLYTDGDENGCRRVKIGEKTVPIYKVVCPDDTFEFEEAKP